MVIFYVFLQIWHFSSVVDFTKLLLGYFGESFTLECAATLNYLLTILFDFNQIPRGIIFIKENLIFAPHFKAPGMSHPV